MITDPWIVYAQEHKWKERIERLERPLQLNLAAACVEHALAAIPLARQALLEEARQALWQTGPEPEPWLSHLQAFAEQVAESPGPMDPPVRAVDALVYVFACLGDQDAPEYLQEARFSAFWALAETVCPTGGWVTDLFGPIGLMEELEVQIGACWQAYRELNYQEDILRHLERQRTPLSRQEALADRAVPDKAAQAAFAGELYRRALENLSGAPGAEKSHLRALLFFAEFEQNQGNHQHAAELYRQALAELGALDSARAAEIQVRLEQLRQI